MLESCMLNICVLNVCILIIFVHNNCIPKLHLEKQSKHIKSY